MNPDRIYIVYEEGGPTQLVRAQSQAQAIRYAARRRFKAVAASAEDVAKMAEKGAVFVADATKLEDAE